MSVRSDIPFALTPASGRLDTWVDLSEGLLSMGLLSMAFGLAVETAVAAAAGASGLVTM
jgi:hypothetical protein